MQQLSPDEEQAARASFPPDDAPTLMEDHLWRIPLPLPFALREVNVYLIGDGAGHWTLVDAGLGLARDEAALRAGLAVAGVPLEAISALVLTHAHPDHVGLSGLIHEASGAPVYMLNREDEILYHVWGEPGAAALRAIGVNFAQHGLDLGERDADPRLTATRAASREATRAVARPNGFSLPPRAAMRTLEDGATLSLGRWRYQVIWTPGHSDYHMCLLREDGFFIAGDHILPAITPNIGLYPDARPDPLADYYASLAKVRDLPTRADALRDHHIERSGLIFALVAAQPAGAAANDIASDLFGARLRSVDDRRFALAETLAHLEHLRARGRVSRERRDGLYRYFAAATSGAEQPADDRQTPTP